MIHKVVTHAEVATIPGPKHVWFDIDKFIVYTDADIPVMPGERTIPVDAFRDRFTKAEMAATLALAYAGDADVQILLFKLQTAKNDEINLDSSEVQQGLDYLVSKSVISTNRMAEIVA